MCCYKTRAILLVMDSVRPGSIPARPEDLLDNSLIFIRIPEVIDTKEERNYSSHCCSSFSIDLKITCLALAVLWVEPVIVP